jgi:valyl-tRNA synthetase
MDILNSDWLINMLKKSSNTPHGRLLSLFEILEDWLDLLHKTQPSIAEQLQNNTGEQTNSHQLQDYLTIEAAKAGAALPEMLASQLYFMAIAACQEKLKCLSNSDYNHASLSHAKSAARALIIAQTKKEFQFSKSSAYAITASFMGILAVVASVYYLNLNANKPQASQIALNQAQLAQPVLATEALTASTSSLADPEQTAALMAQIELMRHGNCQLIEAIQLPDQYKGIYLNMVVNGQVSTDPKEQKIAFALLKQTRCNYTPMLMANSK